MALYTYDPILAFDAVTMAPVADVTGTVTDAETGATVTTYNMVDDPAPLTTNRRGYVPQFKASSPRINITFGGLTLAMEAIENDSRIIAEAVAEAVAASTANVNARVTAAIAADDAPAQAAAAAVNNALVDSEFGDTFVMEQADYVSTLARLSNYDRMTVTRTDSAGTLKVTCATPAGDVVEHTLTPPPRYRYFGTVRTSGQTLAVTDGQTWGTADFTTTGTYSAATASVNGYTTQVGATWTTPITTTIPNAEVRLWTYADNRGGVWRVSLVEAPAVTVDISTWKSAAGTGYRTPVLTVPTPGTYTLRGEFMGDDPANVPSSGAGTARGWASSINTNQNFVQVFSQYGTDEISPLSNKDFALMLRPTTGGSYEFIPYHGVNTEAEVEPAKFYDAGTALDVAALTVGVPVEVDAFEVVQHIYGRNTFSGATNLIEVWTKQRVTPNGVLSVTGRWKALQDVYASSSTYHAMVMGTLSRFGEVTATTGATYTVSPAGAGTDLPLVDDDRAHGYVFLSAATDDVIAVRYNNRVETLRAGQPGKPPTGQAAFIEQRDDGTMAKVYQRLYVTGTLVPAGSVHRFEADYFFGTIPGIRGVLSAA